MGLSFRIFTALALICTVASCEAHREIELASVTGVGPEMLEYGQPLVISGKGFTGDDPRIVFHGKWLQLGKKQPVETRITIAATIENDTRIKIYPTTYLGRRWGADAVAFRGYIEVILGGRLGTYITGRSENLKLYFSCRRGMNLFSTEIEDRSRAFMSDWGLEIVDNGSELVISGVKQNTTGSGIGLRKGDVLVSIESWEMDDVLDLGYFCSSCSSRYEVLRNGQLLSLNRTYSPFTEDVSLEMIGAVVLFGMFTGLFWTYARGRGGKKPQAPPVERHESQALLLLVSAAGATAFAALVPSFHLLAGSGPDLSVILIAVLIGGLILDALAGGSNRSISFIQRAGSVLKNLGYALPPLAMLTVFLAHGSIHSLNEYLYNPHLIDSSWGIVLNPFNALIAIFTISAGRNLMSLTSMPLSSGFAGRFAAIVSLSVIFAITGLGGWSLPSMSIEGAFMKGIVLSIKAWCVPIAGIIFQQTVARRKTDNEKKDGAMALACVIAWTLALYWTIYSHDAFAAKAGRLCAMGIIAVWSGMKIAGLFPDSQSSQELGNNAQASPTAVRK